MFKQNISYAELLSLWKRGLRNGAFRKMPVLKRGLFSAALEYARMTGAIVNQKLVEMVSSVAELIGTSLGQRIFRHGLERAVTFSRNLKITRYFPTAHEWTKDSAYIFWLGTTLLEKQGEWLLFQFK